MYLKIIKYINFSILFFKKLYKVEIYKILFLFCILKIKKSYILPILFFVRLNNKIINILILSKIDKIKKI